MTYSTMAEAEANTTSFEFHTPAPAPTPTPRPDTRGKSKHWTKHRFTAKFVEFVYTYDRHSLKQVRQAALTDVKMDGLPLTLNWTVACPRSLAEMCTAPGVVVEFEAEYSTTSHDAKRAGHALLRPPFRPTPTA